MALARLGETPFAFLKPHLSLHSLTTYHNISTTLSTHHRQQQHSRNHTNHYIYQKTTSHTHKGT